MQKKATNLQKVSDDNCTVTNFVYDRQINKYSSEAETETILNLFTFLKQAPFFPRTWVRNRTDFWKCLVVDLRVPFLHPKWIWLWIWVTHFSTSLLMGSWRLALYVSIFTHFVFFYMFCVCIVIAIVEMSVWSIYWLWDFQVAATKVAAEEVYHIVKRGFDLFLDYLLAIMYLSVWLLLLLKKNWNLEGFLTEFCCFECYDCLRYALMSWFGWNFAKLCTCIAVFPFISSYLCWDLRAK